MRKDLFRFIWLQILLLFNKETMDYLFEQANPYSMYMYIYSHLYSYMIIHVLGF
jgi:hypothetical protein